MKALQRAEEGFHELMQEEALVQSALEVQKQVLSTLPSIILSHFLKFHKESSSFNDRMNRMKQEMLSNNAFISQRTALAKQLMANQAMWKENELHQKQYRDMMMTSLHQQIRDEEHSLRILVSNLNSQLAAYDLAAQNLWGGQQPQEQQQPTQEVAHAASRHHRQPLQPYAQPSRSTPSRTAQNASASVASAPALRQQAVCAADASVMEIDTTGDFPSSYEESHLHVVTPDEASCVSEAPMAETRHGGSHSVLSVEWLQQQGRGVHYEHYERYELSVSPWFHEVKRRRMDVYALHDMQEEHPPRNH